jgi:hypothetical protein
MSELVDSINNQFLFYFFLQKLSNDFLTFIENNNININYYCFNIYVIENITHIITSKTHKNPIGHKLITIQIDNEVAENNYISQLASNTYIRFENFNIEIKNFENIQAIKVISDSDDNEIDTKNICDIININTFYPQMFPNLETINFKNTKHLNSNILKSLPQTLKTLILSDDYNEVVQVGVLPTLLSELVFGERFNKEITLNVLPKSLQKLTFSRYYNQPFAYKVLPDSIKLLVLGDGYTCYLRYLPAFLIYVLIICDGESYITDVPHHMRGLVPEKKRCKLQRYHEAWLRNFQLHNSF